MAFHVSSKDTPNWVWTTFEHVNNPGRCDFTGCNDAYGYSSQDKIGTGQATNYTQPKIKCDGLLQPNYLFDTGTLYPGDTISPGLNDLFSKLGIGQPNRPTRCEVQGPDKKELCIPPPADTGWRSYRLKGSQVEFTDSMGRPTRLENSVIEGGFANSSSCINCHARAGTTGSGTVPPALGVFVNELNEEGYGQSHFGVPVPDWYHHSGQPPVLNVLQTDFVWGFLSANPLPGTSPVQIRKVQPVKDPPSVRGRTQLPAQPP